MTFDLHHVLKLCFQVSCDGMKIKALAKDATKQEEQEQWEIADAVTVTPLVLGHLRKAETWWSLYHRPMAAASGCNHCLAED